MSDHSRSRLPLGRYRQQADGAIATYNVMGYSSEEGRLRPGGYPRMGGAFRNVVASTAPSVRRRQHELSKRIDKKEFT